MLPIGLYAALIAVAAPIHAAGGQVARSQVKTGAISLTSPLDYQVFQRRALMKGRIQIDGRVRISADRIEAHLTGNSLRGALNGNWARLTLNKSTGEFHASLATIPGGFYELDVRALKAGSPVAEITVPHVGVGEVFIVSGQSNATNYGEVRQVTETHTMVQLALAWVLRRPEVSSAIIGASRPEQVEANVRAVGVKLPGAVLQRIDEAIAKVVVR